MQSRAISMGNRASNAKSESPAMYDSLIEPHRARLRRHAYQLTRSVAEADDLVQETLIRAYTRLHLLRGEDSILGWLSKIQLNVFRNNLRCKDLQTHAHQILDSSVEVDTLGKILGSGTTVADPEESTIRTEQNVMIIGAVMGLPRTYREAIILFDIRGESYQTIADRISVPIGTVRSRIHRGRKMLRDSLTAWQRAH